MTGLLPLPLPPAVAVAVGPLTAAPTTPSSQRRLAEAKAAEKASWGNASAALTVALLKISSHINCTNPAANFAEPNPKIRPNAEACMTASKLMGPVVATKPSTIFPSLTSARKNNGLANAIDLAISNKLQPTMIRANLSLRVIFSDPMLRSKSRDN